MLQIEGVFFEEKHPGSVKILHYKEALDRQDRCAKHDFVMSKYIPHENNMSGFPFRFALYPLVAPVTTCVLGAHPAFR